MRRRGALIGRLSGVLLLLASLQAVSVARAGAAERGGGPVVSVTLTTHDLSDALSSMPTIRFSRAPTGARTLHVDGATRYQRMLGFGAAMTDSSAFLLSYELSPSSRASVMQSLFGASDGIHLNFIRVPMGAPDFSALGIPYTYDDLPAGQTDPTLADFSVAHDQAYIIPRLQEMLSIDPSIDILATAWSPPAWMKDNDALDDTDGLGTLAAADYEPLADYFVDFIDAYRAQGIPIWGITPENEPLARRSYPSLDLPAANEARFIVENLVPSLDRAGLRTRIFGMDGAWPAYARELTRSGAAADLAGMAWHCYGGQQAIGDFHRQYPDVMNLMSECSPGIIPYGAAEAAISGARNWASSIDLWNLALDPSGGPVEPTNSGCPDCSGLVTISEQTHAAVFSHSYYELGQLSKFVQPGAVRIGTERWVSEYAARNGSYGVSTGLDNVAFLNPDGTRVLVAYNNSNAPIRFGVSSAGRQFAYRLAARGTVTFRWR